MAESIIQKGGGGAGSDECTAEKAHVLAGYTAVTKDSGDEPIGGGMTNCGAVSRELAAGGSYTVPAGFHNGSGKVTAKSLASQTGGGTATDGYVYTGKTYWKDGALRTGSMTVNSILSFSAAAYGGKQILLKWQNPYAATGKPFSGVVITYSTSGYPGSGGTVIYQGAGNNTAAGGWSQAIVTMPSYGTTYYFSCRAYATCSAGTMYSGVSNASAATYSELWLSYTAAANYTIPAGRSRLDVFLVGAGGGCATPQGTNGGSGGTGGYTKTMNGISVSPGQVINIVVGAGSVGNGGQSSVSRSGTVLASVEGGEGWGNKNLRPSGGSGGGAGAGTSQNSRCAGQGGTNGGDGYTNGSSTTSSFGLSKGQGTTTRAWGSSSGTLYAGGGGGGCRGDNASVVFVAGAGGAGGGGSGAKGYQVAGANGAAGTGGGAGGSGQRGNSGAAISSSGGSGIVLLHVY